MVRREESRCPTCGTDLTRRKRAEVARRTLSRQLSEQRGRLRISMTEAAQLADVEYTCYWRAENGLHIPRKHSLDRLLLWLQKEST